MATTCSAPTPAFSSSSNCFSNTCCGTLGPGFARPLLFADRAIDVTTFTHRLIGGYALISKVSIWLMALLLVAVGTAPAGTLEDLVGDLQPVPGYVVLPVQDEYLIDLDATQGPGSGGSFQRDPTRGKDHPSGDRKGHRYPRHQQRVCCRLPRSRKAFPTPRRCPVKPTLNVATVSAATMGCVPHFGTIPAKPKAFTARSRQPSQALDWQDFAAAQAEKPVKPASAGCRFS